MQAAPAHNTDDHCCLWEACAECQDPILAERLRILWHKLSRTQTKRVKAYQFGLAKQRLTKQPVEGLVLQLAIP